MVSNEAMKILVEEAVTLLMKDDPNWDKGLEGLAKEDVIEIMKNVTKVYADCRVFALMPPFAIVYDKTDESIERIIRAAMVLNPIK